MAIAKRGLTAYTAGGVLLLGALVVRHRARRRARASDITPELMADIDQVWLHGHHPLKAGKLLREASALPPKRAAQVLMKRIAKTKTGGNRTAALHSLGVAVGPLTRTRKSKDARGIWRSTLPVMLISYSPRRPEKLPGAIALQLGFLLYGSTDASQVEQAETFAQAFRFFKTKD